MGKLLVEVQGLAVVAALAIAGCKAPDSSGLYEPGAIRTDTPRIEPDGASSDSGVGDRADDGAGPSTPSDTEPAALPGARPVDAGDGEPPLAPPTPAAPRADAGSPSEAIVPDAGEEPPPPPPPGEPDCAGTLQGGFCWYLGEPAQACNTVCAPHGGFEPASAASVGTPAQGGALEACAAVLEALGEPPGSVLEGVREDTLGFGCHIFVAADGTTSAWWLTSPELSPSVSSPSARLACACVG